MEWDELIIKEGVDGRILLFGYFGQPLIDWEATTFTRSWHILLSILFYFNIDSIYVWSLTNWYHSNWDSTNRQTWFCQGWEWKVFLGLAIHENKSSSYGRERDLSMGVNKDKNYDCKFKLLAILLVDETESDDSGILILSDKEWEERATDLVTLNEIVAQNCKLVDSNEKLISFDKVIKLKIDKEREST